MNQFVRKEVKHNCLTVSLTVLGYIILISVCIFAGSLIALMFTGGGL
jgi:hypothetical protein